jgi:phage terminase large subunit-like protein
VAFTISHFEKWCKTLKLDNGKPVRLEPFQREFCADIFAGQSVSWLVVPEGNGKTTLLAALGLYGLVHAEDASIPLAASARDQARIMYRQMKGFVTRSDLGQERNGVWVDCFDGYRQIQLRKTGKTKRGEVAGVIEVHAADAGTADGVIPFPYAFLDELHRHKDLALHRTWDGKLIKRGAQMIVISTAGEPGHDFEVTREKIKAEALEKTEKGSFTRYVTERIVLHDWSVKNDEIGDVQAVKAANPLKAITPAYLIAKQKNPAMTEAHWRRFTCNLATMDENKEPYIDLQDWDNLEDALAEIPEQAVVCLGGDGSRTWDTTVIAWAMMEDEIVTVDARVFSVRANIDSHVLHRGGKIDFDDVESFIIDRFDEYEVSEVAYDPRYLERSMDIVEERLSESCVFPVEPSSKAMREALQAMFNLASEGKLRHRGDKIIRQHIANAGVDRGYSSEIRRITKIDPRLPIDAVPAMALAVWRASQVPVMGGEYAFV